MKEFLRRLGLFALLPLFVAALTFMKADGRTDPYYLRFTTPRASSLILGTSRAAQGVQPQVLDSALRANGKLVRSFNYSFAIGLSNYGPVYLRSVLKKLEPTGTDGIFVLTVDPWGLAGREGSTEGYEGEDDWSFLASMDLVNMDPNIEYLLTEYDKPLLRIILPDPRVDAGKLTLHKDGWLDVAVPMAPEDIEERTLNKLNEYRTERVPGQALSAMRLGYLSLLVDTLKQHGTVLLVRLPVGARMRALEDSLAPNFNAVMDKMARSKGSNYLDMTQDERDWTFIDGHHLASSSGSDATIAIAQALLSSRQ